MRPTGNAMLQTFDKSADPKEIVNALARDGGAIVANQVPHDLVDNVISEPCTDKNVIVVHSIATNRFNKRYE
jgi:hypothetical protein